MQMRLTLSPLSHKVSTLDAIYQCSAGAARTSPSLMSCSHWTCVDSWLAAPQLGQLLVLVEAVLVEVSKARASEYTEMQQPAGAS